jgi:hypothetical protein
MRIHTTAILVAGLLLTLLVVAPTATPFRVETATDDATAPAIERGDAYVTVPADEIEDGDIVVFWAAEEGRFLTRSVAGVTEGGYRVGGTGDPGGNATSGGGNAIAGERVVPRSAIVGKLATVGGAPVVLPGLGGVVAALAASRVVGLFVALLVVAGALLRRRLSTGRSGRTATVRLRTVAVPLLVVLFVTCVAITPLSATSYRLTYAVTETGETGIGVGEDVTREVSLPASSPPLTRWVVEGDGVTVANWTPERGAINSTLSVPPPEEAGRTVVAVHLFPYPAWVPASLVEAAHDIHPAVASLLGAVTLVGPLALAYRLFLDGDRPIAHFRRRRLQRLRGK